MKKIVVIGANESIAILIRKAKSRGFETHVFSNTNGDEGAAEADFFYEIDVKEKEKILEKCIKIKPSGVCSITSDIVVPTVNYVSRKLGLTSNPERMETVARNKYLMRQAFKDKLDYNPNFWIEENEELNTERYVGRFPLIVKPTDAWSSRGVARVENAEQLQCAIARALNASLEHKAIVEEYIEGEEYSAECICYAGDIHILALTKKATTGFPNYIETAHTQPVHLADSQKDKIHEVVSKAISALDIRNGAAHAEFKITPDGKIALIEIGARMGGDCIGTILTPMSTGYDYVGMVLDVSCGMKPDFSVVNGRGEVGIRYIVSEDDVKEYTIFKEEENIEIIKEEIDYMNLSGKVEDSSTRHGYFIYRKKQI